MATRPVWKGQVRLSLVSIPVEIFPATKSGAQIAFRQIHAESGKRVHYDKVVEGVGSVESDEIVKGYEVAKNDYVLLTDEEIEGVKIDTKKTLELVQFVDSSEIPPLYYDRAYYVVPQDELAEDAYRVVRDALRKSSKTGLGQLSMRGKEYLVGLRPCGNGLLLETLHYRDEIRKADRLFEDISGAKADPDLLAVASELINRKTEPFDAGAFKDRYVEALKRLIAEKRESNGELVIEDRDQGEEKKERNNVVDLMAALKKSLEGGGKASGPKAGPKAPAKASTPKKTAPARASRSKPASKRKSA